MRMTIVLALLCSLLISYTTKKERFFYIAPYGNDANPGTKAAPFASITAAQKAVRLFKKEQPDVSVTVLIAAGVYSITTPIIFTKEDGGRISAPVTYKAMDKATPAFTGGKKITGWAKVSDPAMLKKLSPAASDQIFVTDVTKMGITDYGDPTEPGKRPELFCNNQLQTLARWPDTGFAVAGKAKGKTKLPPTYLETDGTKEGVFEYSNAAQNKWIQEQDIRVSGYFYWDWAEGFHKAAGIDTLTHTIALEQPYHSYGFKDGFRYFGLNLLSELDIPGEWYLDRKDGMLYWYPPTGIHPANADVVLSSFSEEFMIQLQNCSYLTIEGIALQETRGSAFKVEAGDHCQIRDCKIERMGKDGIHVIGGKTHVLKGNYLSGLGFGGFKVNAGDRKTLIPSGHVIENNIVEHFSLFKRTYEPAIHFEGCGIRIAHNRFRYSASSAMRLEGNDVLVEYNEISHVVNESDDQGGIDLYYNPSYRGNIFRYNYWSNITGGTRFGAAGIRLDDMISGTLIYGNVFEKCGVLQFGAVQIHGGKENVVDNNIFYNCHAAVSFSSWAEERWLAALELPVMKKKLYEDVNILSPVYQQRYPDLKKLKEGINVNMVKNNLIVSCEFDFLNLDEKQQLSNNSILSSNGKSLSAFCQADLLKNYGLQPVPFSKMGLVDNKWRALSKYRL